MRRYATMVAAATLGVLVALASGCSSKPTSPDAAKPPPGVGLRAIRERGTLRLITRNNGFSYFVLRGRALGFDYELAERFAEHLGVKLEVLVPPEWDEQLELLERGQGDVLGANVSVTPGREQRIAFALPYGLTQIRAAWGPGQEAIHDAEDLSGRSVHVRGSSVYFVYLQRLSGMLEAAGKRPVDIVLESEALDTEDLLREAALGRIPYTLTGQERGKEVQAFTPQLTLGPAISEPFHKAWAVHKDAKDLLDALNAFLLAERQRGLDKLYRRYHAAPKLQAKRHEDPHYVDAQGHISAYDAPMREAGERFGFDWRLLAALAYEESRFDPKAQTDAGGRGLFGVLPQTAKSLRMGSLAQPEESCLIGAAHLSALRGEFTQVADEETRLRFALAAYQSGPEHVQDARLLASQQGLNPNQWDDVAKVLPLLAMREFAAKAAHGYVDGAESVRYVESVWTRYRAYKHAMGERDSSRGKTR